MWEGAKLRSTFPVQKETWKLGGRQRGRGGEGRSLGNRVQTCFSPRPPVQPPHDKRSCTSSLQRNWASWRGGAGGPNGPGTWKRVLFRLAPACSLVPSLPTAFPSPHRELPSTGLQPTAEPRARRSRLRLHWQIQADPQNHWTGSSIHSPNK